jgi:hypothetical protein
MMMRNRIRAIGFAAIAGATILPLRYFAQAPAKKRAIPDAAVMIGSASPVTAHLVGQLQVDTSGNAQLVGYFPWISGLPAAFAGTPSEATAYYTFRSPSFQVQIVANGGLMQILPMSSGATGGTLTYNMYYNTAPNQSFSNPGSFSQGQLVATLTSVQWMTTASTNGGVGSGTFELASSSNFSIQGQSYNMKALGNAVTLVLTIAPSAGPASPYAAFSVPLGGYALGVNAVRAQTIGGR